ncbi:hypothetical protein GOBAR_AA13756 [Gossypium barbadense]|uniref:Uncharacterized protein n=1 Tax=Gossypium barbadense TaxID=3634 RepID=A0A2P5XUD5_GOSBA|nr:hypothetical protein GOBAR_AA13756 [Gossypium barbadense]
MSCPACCLNNPPCSLPAARIVLLATCMLPEQSSLQPACMALTQLHKAAAVAAAPFSPFNGKSKRGTL